MDSFRLIQNFFTRMACQYCDNHFEAEDIHLIREEHGIHVVSVNCHHCQRQVGVAMVGVDASGEAISHDSPYTHRFQDPELTEEEVARLSCFDPITPDDVLEAHHFFQNLDGNWSQLLPKPSEARTPETTLAAEDPEL